MNLLQANIIELVPCALRLVSFTSDAVDVRNYDGPALFILQSSAPIDGINPSLSCKLQHSDTEFSGFTDVPGGGFTEVTNPDDITQMITLQLNGLKRFIRAECLFSGTLTLTFTFGMTMVALRNSGRNSQQWM